MIYSESHRITSAKRKYTTHATTKISQLSKQTQTIKHAA